MLSLYVHIPFCVRKCHYCGFFSTRYDRSVADDYLDALEVEADRYADLFRKRSIGTLYIGGGTPTTLSSEQLSLLITMLERHVHLQQGAEITVEVNPATATQELMAHLRRLGATRISIGVQSFSDAILSALGRIHTAQEAARAFMLARETGFENVGMDLIYGVPHQTAAQWHQTLEKTLRLAPSHISTYCLSADSGSRLDEDVRSGAVALPGDDAAVSMYRSAVNMIEREGFHHYELSNFALPGFACRHNINYWERGEYLGLGAGASSFLGSSRFANIADIAAYCSRLFRGETAVDTREALTGDHASLEDLLLGLRMTAGVDLGRYEHRHGSARRERLLLRIEELLPHGLFLIENGRLRLTSRGMVLADEALRRIVA